MEPDGSPNSQQSLRSRPNYPHPILLEDGGSRATEGSLNSPHSPNSGNYTPDYDPEAPFPHTETPYGYMQNTLPLTNNPPPGMARIGSSPSSPTGVYHPHHFSADPQSHVSNPGSTSSQYTATSSGHSPPRIPEPDYYQGILPFPPPTPAQAISTTPTPNGGYICNVCSLVFTRAHDGRRHYASKHSDIKCQCICGKRFSRRDALLRHQRSDPISGYGGCEEAARAATPTDS